MLRAVATIARYVLVEVGRSATPWLSLAGILAALCLAMFLSQVAISEGVALQASVAAALLRVFAVFLVAVHVVSSVVREANDKGLELALTLPISRPAWYLGKLLGFACAGVLIATFFAMPLAAWAKLSDLAAWWLALAAEAVVVAAAALFFASALGQTVSAITATAAFYLLARLIATIQAIAAGPLAGDGTGGQAARWLVDAFVLLLPRFGTLGSGDWLLYGAPPFTELALALAGLALYMALLAAAGLFDLSRRNL